MIILNRMNFVVVCAGLIITAKAGAWDGTGHMIVAEIAREHMSSQAVARVDAVAAQLDNNGVPYNGVSVACWPDDIKGKDFKSPFQGQFRSWHYINIGCSTNDPDPFANPPVMTVNQGDVVRALTHCAAVIKTKKPSDLVPNEAVALALLIHFVGDIHQPLHSTSRHNPDPKPGDKYKDDAGGNGVSLANLADTPWGKNLHTFWDEAYRRYYEKDEIKAMSELQEATALGSPEMKEWIKRLEPDAPTKPDLKFDVKKWVMESHVIACEQVYGTLDAPYGSRDVKLSEKYVADATATARRRLVLAGYRLAALLNELYGK